MALIDNCVAYYKLDEAAGATADNAEGTAALDGSNSGATVNQAGLLNTAYLFDGTDDIITFGYALTATSGSLSFWMYPHSTNNEESPMGGDAAGNHDGDWLIQFYNGGKLYYDIDDSGEKYVISNSAIPTNEWTHVVVLWGSGGMKMYINGTLQTSTQATEEIPDALNWYIGRYFPASGEAFDGLIDEVGYWSRRLTGTEITALYNSGAGLAYPFSTGTNISVNIGDVWKDVTTAQVNVGDVWKDVTSASVNVGDVWKTIF